MIDPAAGEALDAAQPLVEVLMSTYNGSRYVAEQIDSILAQTWKPLRLRIRDDGSQDRTWSILQSYAATHPELIAVTRGENLGLGGSFMSLLCSSMAPFCAFADQDDVWLPDKVARAVSCLQAAEDPDKPLLYCSRAIITDQDLTPIGMTILRYPALFSFANALVESSPQGATMVMNRKGRELACAFTFPQVYKYHDWWCYVVVTACDGGVVYESRPSMLYRQHASNVSGAAVTTPGRLWRNLLRRWRDEGGHGRIIPYARVLAQALDGQLSTKDSWRLEQLLSSTTSAKAALNCVLGRAVYRQSWIDNLGMLALMLLRRPI